MTMQSIFFSATKIKIFTRIALKIGNERETISKLNKRKEQFYNYVGKQRYINPDLKLCVCGTGRKG